MNKKYLFIAVIILVYILGVLAFPDIFFNKECYRFSPDEIKYIINCSEMIVENTNYNNLPNFSYFTTTAFQYPIKE